MRTNADIQEWLKIRVSICNVCMSALYILYIINFFILILYNLVILNFVLHTIKNTSYKIKKVILSADIADMQTFTLLFVICRHFACSYNVYV